ncbi:alpha/beta fold hydrolase [Shewanella avicenniae]|uniref:Alpha/beta fold hydrolase n=1 Tax=Shewanella avicenniae TaxID=2814294 RepID=A0ABX7QV16_9GAMM|nr:alpha/beta fold hydrolase [Shewanella avicenniae]QSX34755.1 alpha/beta fold hydrolase [Shewanella avicenniae]
MNCSPDNWIYQAADNADTLLIFAHGAGADMRSEFMQTMADLLVNAGFAVLRFNFPYMQLSALDGKRRPPDRAPKLLASWHGTLDAALAQHAFDKFYLVGKSMGSRMATMLAAEPLPNVVKGVICLGYPFLPKGKAAPRLEAINQCLLPLLIVQGERDSFGTQAQLDEWPLPAAVETVFLADGNHSFEPRKSSGVTLMQNYQQAVSSILAFTRS